MLRLEICARVMLLVLLFGRVGGQSLEIPSVSIATCDPALGFYFDTSSLACVACADDSDGTGRNKGKVPYITNTNTYATSCTCGVGLIEVTENCSDAALKAGTCVGFTCTACTGGGVPYSDHMACTVCGNSTAGVSASTGDCSCSKDTYGYPQYLVEIDSGGTLLSEKQCDACALGSYVFGTTDATVAGEYYSTDMYACKKCPSENMSFTNAGLCVCDSGYTATGAESAGPLTCVETTLVNAVKQWTGPDAYIVTYSNIDTTAKTPGSAQVSSLTFGQYISTAGSLCYSYRGAEDIPECQVLGNLCVLQQYNPATPACAMFTSTLGDRSAYSYGQKGWGIGMPWLLYDSTTTADSIRYSTAINMEVTFDTVLEIKLAKYSMNGTYIGLEDFAYQPYYCTEAPPSDGQSMDTMYLKFAHGMHTSSTCDLSLLLTQEQYFYDPYFLDESTGKLYPIPVLNQNLVSDGGLMPNVNVAPKDEIDDKFSRRFFLFDVSSGISATSNGVPEVIRYASSLQLIVTLQSTGSAKIYPPVLVVSYKESQPASWIATPTLQYPTYTYIVQYTMTTTDFWGPLRACFAVAMVMVGLSAVWRLRSWTIRHSRSDIPHDVMQKTGIDWDQVFTGIFFAAHSFVLIILPLTFSVCGYLFAFFKLQTSVYLVLPEDNGGYGTQGEYAPLRTLIVLLFFFELLYVIRAIRKHCQSGIFLIDWERGSANRKSVNTATVGDGISKSIGSSVWRKLLVANEWNELQAVRRSSQTFTLMLMGFVLIGLGQEYNATAQPDLSDKSPGVINPALQFTNTTFFWFSFTALQWLWRWALAERYFGEPPEQKLLDLATLAKVSIVILDEKFHGYYLHCRSPYPRADVPMEEMAAQLDREESGLTTDRGLEGCPQDLQSFELHVTGTWRLKYDRCYSGLPGANSISGPGARAAVGGGGMAMQGDAWRTGGNTHGHTQGISGVLGARPSNRRATAEQLAKASAALTSFLQGFIEQSYTHGCLKWAYREVSTADVYLGNPPDLRQQAGSPCLLYPDRYGRFTQVLYLGIELDLTILDAMAFATFDLWFGDTATSIILTYLLGQGLAAIRGYMGRDNLSRKAMVDARFLI